MKKLNTIKKFLILTTIIFFTSNSISLVYSQNGELINGNKIEDIIANYEKSLNSENHGVRMSTVEYIGRYQMTNFEDKLIEMLTNTQTLKDKKIIALSLFQLGSLQSIKVLGDSFLASNNPNYKEFCRNLLDMSEEYIQLRLKYFESLAASMPEIE